MVSRHCCRDHLRLDVIPRHLADWICTDGFLSLLFGYCCYLCPVYYNTSLKKTKTNTIYKMEGLTMVDRQPHHAHAVYHGPRHVDVRPAQLPLPTPYGSYKRPSPGPPASMYHSETQSETNHSSYSTLKRASVSRGVSTIQTPSFQRGDQPRPSLPSLRTVSLSATPTDL